LPQPFRPRFRVLPYLLHNLRRSQFRGRSRRRVRKPRRERNEQNKKYSSP